MVDPAAVVSALRAELPEAVVVSDPDVADAYRRDRAMTVAPGRPLAVVRAGSTAEVAATMRVSNMTVYRLIKSGELRAARIGKSYRITEADVDAYLAARYSDVG
jgi:excisionase family DNA binding protein